MTLLDSTVGDGGLMLKDCTWIAVWLIGLGLMAFDLWAHIARVHDCERLGHGRFIVG